MFLADFGSLYTYCSSGNKDELPDDEESDIEERNLKNLPQIRLLNDMGCMRKRKRRAVIRSPRFSKIKFPEKFFHSVLMLYLPWRNEETDLLGTFSTYEEHYLSKEQEIIHSMETFEKESGLLDAALQLLQSEESHQDEWNSIAAGTEQEQMDARAEGCVVDEDNCFKIQSR